MPKDSIWIDSFKVLLILPVFLKVNQNSLLWYLKIGGLKGWKIYIALDSPKARKSQYWEGPRANPQTGITPVLGKFKVWYRYSVKYRYFTEELPLFWGLLQPGKQWHPDYKDETGNFPRNGNSTAKPQGRFLHALCSWPPAYRMLWGSPSRREECWFWGYPHLLCISQHSPSHSMRRGHPARTADLRVHRHVFCWILLDTTGPALPVPSGPHQQGH